MNPTIRLMVLSVAAGALARAVVAPASGRQTGRRGAGNSAEVERLERERREREMHERDLRERQFMLRNLGVEGPAERPQPRLAVSQIRADFVRLQVVNNDLARAVSRGGALDLKFVAKSASEIRKLAGRLRDNLALPAPGDGPADPRAKAAPGHGQLGPALSALDGLILGFTDALASGSVNLIDARSSAKARSELEEIIALSGWVKKTSEKLEKAARQSQ
ncbi:MAG: hypothetical protein M3416_13180 [Acidobacteriota bacterium]|nr:hypothetical protein [Acidobacteriota bacterium]